MSDDLINLAWIGGCMILIVSALVSRRLSKQAWLRIAAIWVAIIGAVWLVFLLAGRLLTNVDLT